MTTPLIPFRENALPKVATIIGDPADYDGERPVIGQIRADPRCGKDLCASCGDCIHCFYNRSGDGYCSTESEYRCRCSWEISEEEAMRLLVENEDARLLWMVEGSEVHT